MYVKRSDDFAVAVTERGEVLLWRDLASPAAGGAPRPAWIVAHRASQAPLRAAAAEREDAIAWVGDGGMAFVSDGTRAVRVETSTSEDLLAVALRPDGAPPHTEGAPLRIWAAGSKGTLLRGTSARLDRISSGTTETLRALAMIGPDDGLAAGDGGVVVGIVRGSAAVVDAGVDVALRGAWASRERAAIWLVGDGGTVLRKDSAGFHPERSGVTETLRAVAGGDGGVLVAVGDGGVVLSRGRDDRWRREAVPAGTGDLVSVTIGPRGTWLAARREGGWLQRGPGGRFERVDAPGVAPVLGVAPLPYLRVYPRMPRDVRWIKQSAAPVPSEDDYWASPRVEMDVQEFDRTAVQRGFDTPILYGGITSEPWPDAPNPRWETRDYNTAIMLDRAGRVVGMYDKVYLLVGGEYLPGGDWWPGLYDLIPNTNRFEPGREVKVFQWGQHRIGVMVCYEDILPQFNGRLADREPNVIINVTNDAWFGYTAEPYLHLALATFRAVENRLAVVRSTNTGVSAFIEPTGRISAQTSMKDQETLVHDVPMLSGRTLYGRLGDAFSYALLAWLAVVLLARAVRSKRRR
jgi:predicted amidohydrolase